MEISKIDDFKTLIEANKNIIRLYEKNNLKLPLGIIGDLGEFSVMLRLMNEGKNPQLKSGRSRFDILLNNKRLEIKTGRFRFEKKKRLGRLAENTQINPKKLDYLIFVTINEDLSETNFFILNTEDVNQLPESKFYGKKEDKKEIFLLDKPYNEELSKLINIDMGWF